MDCKEYKPADRNLQSNLSKHQAEMSVRLRAPRCRKTIHLEQKINLSLYVRDSEDIHGKSFNSRNRKWLMR